MKPKRVPPAFLDVLAFGLAVAGVLAFTDLLVTALVLSP